MAITGCSGPNCPHQSASAGGSNQAQQGQGDQQIDQRSFQLGFKAGQQGGGQDAQGPQGAGGGRGAGGGGMRGNSFVA
ncbi:MAG: hypothetical protein KC476_04875 [Cyanobacteria bacterium HKST-UBA06]|nr:hypothetical protein [Cyanobacteria bacterium HKST-UBA06]MCA9842756.1 hypothetical protein [Cyanobacteria bacterium HKST-UBA03]